MKKIEITLQDPDHQFTGLMNKIRDQLYDHDTVDIVVDPHMSEVEGGKDSYRIKKEDGFRHIDIQQKVTIFANDTDNALMRLIEKVKRHSDPGHSFDVVVDPDIKQADGGNKSFGMDGDGSFEIIDIKKTYKKDKVAEIVAEGILKQAAPIKANRILNQVKKLHSGETKKNAISEARKAKETFHKFNTKVGDNPMFVETMNELRKNSDQARKNAIKVSRQTTAIKAAPFVAAGTTGGVIADEVNNHQK